MRVGEAYLVPRGVVGIEGRREVVEEVAQDSAVENQVQDPAAERWSDERGSDRLRGDRCPCERIKRVLEWAGHRDA